MQTDSKPDFLSKEAPALCIDRAYIDNEKSLEFAKTYSSTSVEVFNEEIKLYPWSGSKVSGMIEHRTFVSVEGNDEPTFYTYGRYSLRKPV